MRTQHAMFVPDWLRTNAYRVLGLSANASPSQIHRAARSMRRAAALGLVSSTEADISLLGEVPRTEASIRTATGRLADPASRLEDRLFWFHELPAPKNPGAPAVAEEAIAGPPEGAARRHDDALHGLFAAFEAGFDHAGIAVWVRALRAWHQTVSDDDYWALVLTLEEQGMFEPAALISDLDALRDDAVRMAADGLMVAARDALARSDTPTVRRILTALKELADTGPWAGVGQEDIASPAFERFRGLCRAIREECASMIARDGDSEQRNKTVCDGALKRFRDEIEPALDGVTQILPPDHELAQQSREEAALCLSTIAIDYTWADDFIASETLHEEALTLAQGTLGAGTIEIRLAEVRESAREQRVFGALKPITSAPLLGTINGLGFTLHGKSDFDHETQSYSTTHYFAAFFIPIFPVGRYRVIDMGDNRYNFLGKLPLRKGDRWHIGLAATAIVVAMMLGGVFSLSQNSGSSYTPSTTSSYGSSSYVPSPSSTTPGASQKGAPEQQFTNSRQSRLSSLKDRIDSVRLRMAMLESRLQPVIDELTTLESRVEALASELKSLDRQDKAGIRIDVHDYNARVELHNRLLSRYEAVFAAHGSELEVYNRLVEENNALVAQFKALQR